MVASTTGEWGGAYSCHYIHDISQRQHYSESVIHSIKYLCHSNKDHLTRMICSLSGLHWFKRSSFFERNYFICQTNDVDFFSNWTFCFKMLDWFNLLDVSWEHFQLFSSLRFVWTCPSLIQNPLDHFWGSMFVSEESIMSELKYEKLLRRWKNHIREKLTTISSKVLI